MEAFNESERCMGRRACAHRHADRYPCLHGGSAGLLHFRIQASVARIKTVLLQLVLLFGLALAGSLALADPPARVGSIAYLQGEVEFRPAYDAEAAPALQNWPLTSHNVITTGPGARAELRVGSTALRLDGDSELEIAELDEQILHLRLLGGSLNVRVKNPDLVAGFELNTAQGRLTLTAPSQLHADAGRSPGTTVISLFSGAARFDSGADSTPSALTLVAGQRATSSYGTLEVSTATPDDFDRWSLARDQRDDQSVSARYVSPELTGYEALDQYGAWSMSDDYGAIWIPQSVPADWAPYRDGSWTWIDPWGWTWIDAAPWGYAPFHYGRWAWYRQRWCWVPGRVVARPVWAPALVGWVGGGNWNAQFSSGNAPAVGWFPLAPHEDFRPGYPISPGYARRLNDPFSGRGNRPDSQAIYRNRLEHGAVTVIPHERFEQRRTIAVGRAPALSGASQQLLNAPLSATMPATPARPPLTAVPRAIPEQRREFQRQPVSPSTPATTLVPPAQRLESAPHAVEQRHQAAPVVQPPRGTPQAPGVPNEHGQNGNERRQQFRPEQQPAPHFEQRSAPLTAVPRAIPEQRREFQRQPTPAATLAPPAQRLESAPHAVEQRHQAAPVAQPPRSTPQAPGVPNEHGQNGNERRQQFRPEQQPAPHSEQRSVPGRTGLAVPPSGRSERVAPIEAGRSRQLENRGREGDRPARGGGPDNR
ncbi:MAG TPA: DUF6600 domain-containing protein [Burkholderiaceae bacterium]|nr:DUF6600 domain-containing protein [Burkholderiaceae bacterium]